MFIKQSTICPAFGHGIFYRHDLYPANRTV
jgi:hypothetical protein